MTIRTKILLMLTLPLLALAVVGAIGFRDQSQDQEMIEDAQIYTEQLHDLEALSLAVGHERLVVASGDGLTAQTAAQQDTDAALTALADPDGSWADQLAILRPMSNPSRQVDAYTQLLWDLDVAIQAVPTTGLGSDSVTRVIANRASSRGVLAQEEAWISFLDAAEFDQGTMLDTAGSFTDAESRLSEAASLRLQDGDAPFASAAGGPASIELARLQELAREDLIDGTPGQIPPDRVFAALVASRSEWSRTILANSDEVVDAAIGRADGISDRRSLFTLLGVLGAALLAALVFVISRSILGPLERLIHDADKMTQERLPFAVASLRTIGSNDELPTVPAIPKESDDEIGSLVDAFNDVQVTALRVATDQARSRRNVAEMFVSLGRRNQQLLQRMLRQISELENDESDPETLRGLYQLDHLATRMRRNAESLLVLAGNRTPRQWSRPVPVEEAVRSAIAEVEHYNRIEVGDLNDVAWAGASVADITHLLAELLENATQFSEPSTTVTISTRSVDGGTSVEIADSGFGMSADDLAANNDRIANPPMLDAAPARLLGLFVVGRLAEQHHITVHLDSQPGLGTVAHIFVPPNLHAEIVDAPVAEPETEPESVDTFARSVNPELADVIGAVVDESQNQTFESYAESPVAASPPPVPQPVVPQPAATVDEHPAVEPGFPSVVPDVPAAVQPAPSLGDLPVRDPQASLRGQELQPMPETSITPPAVESADGPAAEAAATSVSAFVGGVTRGLQETRNEAQPGHTTEDEE